MKTKILVVTLVSLAFMTLGLLKANSRSQQIEIEKLNNAPDKGTIAWQVRLAKVKGERQVSISAPVVEYASSGASTDEILSHYNAVVVQPIVKVNSVYEERGQIISWYKFRIVENLNQKDLTPCSACSSDSIPPPEELLPINTDEFLIAKYGGTVVIDNIKVATFNDRFPDLILFNKYLMFISLLPSRVAGIGVGPEAIFTVNDDEALEPINDKPHVFKRDIKTRFNHSLDLLRRDLRTRALSQ